MFPQRPGRPAVPALHFSALPGLHRGSGVLAKIMLDDGCAPSRGAQPRFTTPSLRTLRLIFAYESWLFD